MITVLFFARYRDALQTPQLKLPSESLTCVADLMNQLRERGPTWNNVMTDSHCIIAVNQTVADPSTLLKAGDEIAFYPPVTGG